MFCLPLVSSLLVFLLEKANIEQGRIRFSAKHIFIYIAWTPHRLIGKQRLDASREVIDTIRRSVIKLIESSPFQTTHRLVYHREGGRHPVYHRTEVSFQLSDLFVAAMFAHIGIDSHAESGTHPFECHAQMLLSFHIAFHVVAPLLRFRVLRITEHTLGCADKRARIDGIAQFLLVERNPNNVDGLEPLFHFTLFALTNIHQKFGIENELLLFLWEAGEILNVAVGILYGKLTGDETPQRGDALLAVQHLILSGTGAIEVYQSQGITT